MSILVNPLQPRKHQFPNEITDEGNSIFVNPLQPQKHQLPNEITDEGNSIFVNPVQPSKQEFPNEVTDDSISIFVSDVQFRKHFSGSKRSDAAKLIFFIFGFPLRKEPLTEVTVFGIVSSSMYESAKE